jgi:hypothetical protein
MERRDIYSAILRAMAIELPVDSTESKTITGEDAGAFRVRLSLPLVASVEGEISGKDKQILVTQSVTKVLNIILT